MGHYASEMGDYRDYKPSKEVLDAMEKHEQRIHAIVMAGLDGCIAGNNKSFPDNPPSQNEEIIVGKDWRTEARARREKNAVIEVKPANDGDYEDEAVLRISHNGYQFTSVDVSRLEAEKVIASLKAHFGI
jgi:hypothetical protein